MYLTKLIKSKSFNNKGFTLVEIIVVIAIISILALIAVPSYIGYKEKAEKQVCNTNTLQFQK
jgi:prepilin-type N-terminal cleavage/methylation domain-containing protein